MLAAAIPWDSLGCAVCGVAYDGVQGMRLLETKRPDILLKDGRILVADQRAGVRLLDRQGRMIDSLPHVGAVCIGAI